jgi:predicted helicase
MNDADFIKKQNILVVMGNPPYSVSSSNKNDYITKLVNDYKSAKNTVDKDKSVNALSDDYVKFIRFAHNKISRQNKGMIAIITNNSYLDGIVHKTMREKLLQDFDKIYVINLHGNSLRKEGDKNVFDIRVGVCITLFIKLENRLASDKKEVFYYSTLENNLISREQKFEFTEKIYEKLAANDIQNSLAWTKLKPQKPYFFFVPKDLSQQKKYNKFWSLKQIFETVTIGFGTERDSVTIHKKIKSLEQLKKDFLTKTNLANYNIKPQRDWIFEKAVAELETNPPIKAVNYRIFDERFTFYSKQTKGFLSYPRYDVMQHFLSGSNIGLIFTRIVTSKNFKHAFVTDKITERCFISNRGSEANYIAPLYRYEEEMGEKGKKKISKIENLTKDFRRFINETYGESINAEQIFGYIYAVLYSPAYREQYNELLRIDFPRIPFPDDLTPQGLKALAELGWELAQMHLLQKVPELEMADFVGENRQVMKVFWQNEKLYINPVSYFSGISKAVFDYEIGAYRVLHKYLKDRNEEVLSLDEIEHLQNVIKVLAKTVEFENESN